MPFLRAKGLQRSTSGRDRLPAVSVSMPFLRAKGLQPGSLTCISPYATASQCPSCGRRVCNGMASRLSDRTLWSQCPSCGRRVCNDRRCLPRRTVRAIVSMPFLRAKGLQRLTFFGLDVTAMSQCPSCGRRVCNEITGSCFYVGSTSQCPSCGRRVCNKLQGLAVTSTTVSKSQCPSCGRRVCNASRRIRGHVGSTSLNALPAGEGSATIPAATSSSTRRSSTVSMPFLRAKGLQQAQAKLDQQYVSQCPSCGRRVCNMKDYTVTISGEESQCPSCGRRVCNANGTQMFVSGSVWVSMPFLRAKGLQPRQNLHHHYLVAVSMPFLRAKGLQHDSARQRPPG